MDPPSHAGHTPYLGIDMTSSVSRLAMSEILNALVIMSADTPASADEYADVWVSAAPLAAGPLASGPVGQPPPMDPVGWGRSNSIMFLLYMVIGFSVTLGCILAALSCYYLVRYCYSQRGPSRASREDSFTVVPEPKELFVVVHPGGFTDVAYREIEGPVKMVCRSKSIPVTCAYILMPTADLLDNQTGGLIPAYRPEPSPSRASFSERAGHSPGTSQRSISLVAMAVGPRVPPAKPWSEDASPGNQGGTPGELQVKELQSPHPDDKPQLEGVEVMEGSRDGDPARQRQGIVVSAPERLDILSNQDNGQGPEEAPGVVASAVTALELMEAGRLHEPQIEH